MKDMKEQFALSLMGFIEEQYGPIEDQPACKSPIENMMFWALSIAARFRSGVYPAIRTQHKIAHYAVDFFVALHEVVEPGKPQFSASVIVECDGHDFHEKTKEQASKDKQRDRVLQQLGYNVFRFSGSDIWKDPMKCADEVIEFLEQKIDVQSIDQWKSTHAEEGE